MEQDIQSYIMSEEKSWKTDRVPLTNSKDWNMYEHIQRCKNVANAWFNNGKNDGLRPYDDLVTPIINVAFRSQGFDVKDIVPYVNDAENYYKSFLIKKYHPKWARDNEIDTLIDTSVEGSIIYDLVIFKNIGGLPEVQPLESIAFCDQTDVLTGPICFKKQYSIPEIKKFYGKWDDDKINEAIILAQSSKPVKQADNQKAKTPGKYIEVYELHGCLPESWLKEDGDPNKYVDQLQIVNLYAKEDGTKEKITLYKGKSKPLTEIFDALKIDQVRSYGRACGRSIVESLFEPQVWNNYSMIKIKKMLDSAVNLLQTDSDEFGNQPLSQLKENTILKHESGKPITKVQNGITDMDKFISFQDRNVNTARLVGSASDPQLGVTPTSGTPLGTTQIVTSQGIGTHEYRQGKIATFFSDRLYRRWILKGLVEDMNRGHKWLSELTLDEIKYIAKAVSIKESNKKTVDMVIKYFEKKGKAPTQEEIDQFKQVIEQQVIDKGNNSFIEIIEDEFKKIPIDVMVNIAGKQKNLMKISNDISNIIRTAMSNPQAFIESGLTEPFNQLLEASGFSPVNFNKLTTPQAQPVQQQQVAQQPAMAK